MISDVNKEGKFRHSSQDHDLKMYFLVLIKTIPKALNRGKETQTAIQ